MGSGLGGGMKKRMHGWVLCDIRLANKNRKFLGREKTTVRVREMKPWGKRRREGGREREDVKGEVLYLL